MPRPCAVCGALDVQAHHPEYDSAEAHRHVQWLCPTHHAQEHGVRAWTKQMELFAEPPSSSSPTSPAGVTYRAVPEHELGSEHHPT